MTHDEPTLSVKVQPTNPGQFLAACGLLELADRLWNGAEGWFDDTLSVFHIQTFAGPHNPRDLLQSVADAPVDNSMSAAELSRLEQLRRTRKQELSKTAELEKKHLEKLWRESPLILGGPYRLRLNWFVDDQSKGSRFKTWAGQQSVIDIARAMKSPIDDGKYDEVPTDDWIQHSEGTAVTFNFDSDGSWQSSPLDVGFSLDPLKMASASRPFLEFLAFVGLQRFRPHIDARSNRHTYAAWKTPLVPEVAAAVASGTATMRGSGTFCFPLLYRTKYLKSFLPAQRIGG